MITAFSIGVLLGGCPGTAIEGRVAWVQPAAAASREMVGEALVVYSVRGG
jgi:hypothetical protein